MQIRRDDLIGPEIRALLEEHLTNMRATGYQVLDDVVRCRSAGLWCAARTYAEAGRGEIDAHGAGPPAEGCCADPAHASARRGPASRLHLAQFENGNAAAFRACSSLVRRRRLCVLSAVWRLHRRSEQRVHDAAVVIPPASRWAEPDRQKGLGCVRIARSLREGRLNGAGVSGGFIIGINRGS